MPHHHATTCACVWTRLVCFMRYKYVGQSFQLISAPVVHVVSCVVSLVVVLSSINKALA